MKKYISIIAILAILGAVGFALVTAPVTSAQGAPQCSDGIDNDGDGGTDDTDADCHLDGDIKNAGSYDASIWQEAGAALPCPACQANNGGGNGGGGSHERVCSDGLDNDGDGLVDMKDPGCEKPSDRNESNATPVRTPAAPAVLGATTPPVVLQRTGAADTARIAANVKAVAQAKAEQNFISIPKLGVNKPILQMSDIKALRSEVWILPWTSTPDKGGNTVMVGHSYNNVKGKYSVSTFYNLDTMKEGDTINVTWKGVNYTYRVTMTGTTDPSKTMLEKQTATPTLTIYGCGKFTNLYRTYVRAELVTE